ncbi:MAG: hypothetical protein KAH05_04800 [Clostridiales bacterium]|nr:hypothetical protein [Clostridiales bacterium]
MNGLAFLGLFLLIYAVAVFFIAAKKPSSIWKMKKIQMFVNLLGEKGTVIFFYIWGAIALGFGIWLLVR